jgi:hypothetical protein
MYLFRAEYDIRLYSPLSYNSFGRDSNAFGKWHNVAYAVYRVLNNLSILFNNVTKIRRVLRKHRATKYVSKHPVSIVKCSTFSSR